MGFKLIKFKLPDELLRQFKPLWDEMAMTPEGGGVIFDINEASGYCVGCFFPRKDYLKIQELTGALQRKYEE